MTAYVTLLESVKVLPAAAICLQLRAPTRLVGVAEVEDVVFDDMVDEWLKIPVVLAVMVIERLEVVVIEWLEVVFIRLVVERVNEEVLFKLIVMVDDGADDVVLLVELLGRFSTRAKVVPFFVIWLDRSTEL